MPKLRTNSILFSMQKIYTFLFIAISASITSVQAQLFPNLGGQRAGISAYSFLKMDVSPRSSAMGGASLCQTGDAFSAYVNPAGLAEIEKTAFALSHTFWAAGLTQSFLTGSAPTKYGTFGGSLNFLSSGAMPVRTVFEPDGTGQQFYATYSAVGLSYSKKLTDHFSYGISGKWVHEQLAQMQANTGTIDLGFLYRTDFKDLSFGVNVQNFGINSKLAGNWKIDSTFYNKVQSLDNFPPPTVFQLGISMIPYKNAAGDQSLTVAVQLNHPNDNAENIRIGAEYNYKSLFFARLGYKVNVKDQPYPTFGAGLRARIGKHPLRFDYAFEPLRYLGNMHKIGLALLINSEKRE